MAGWRDGRRSWMCEGMCLSIIEARSSELAGGMLNLMENPQSTPFPSSMIQYFISDAK